MKNIRSILHRTSTATFAPRWRTLFCALGIVSGPMLAQTPQPLDAMTFEQITHLRRTHATIYAPVKLTASRRLGLHLINGGTPQKSNGSEQGVRVICYVIKPDGSGLELFSYESIPASSAGAVGGGAMGAGKVAMRDFSVDDIPKDLLAPDGSAHVILAVAGYNITRAGATPIPCILPRDLFLSAQVDGVEIGMLLPAVQKVR